MPRPGTIVLLAALYAPVALAAEPMPVQTMIIRPDDATTQVLTARGVKAMDRYSDISAARLLLRRAADGGDADAARRMAQTYDLVWLHMHHVVGEDGLADPERMFAWYKRAAELGDTSAENRYVVGIAK